MARNVELTIHELRKLREDPVFDQTCRDIENYNLNTIPNSVSADIKRTLDLDKSMLEVKEWLIRDWEEQNSLLGKTRYIPGTLQETEAFLRWREGLDSGPSSTDKMSLENRIWEQFGIRYPQKYELFVLQKAQEALENEQPEKAAEAEKKVISEPLTNEEAAVAASAVVVAARARTQKQSVSGYKNWQQNQQLRQEAVNKLKADAKSGVPLKEQGYVFISKEESDKRTARHNQIKNAKTFEEDPRYLRRVQEYRKIAGEAVDEETITARARASFAEKFPERAAVYVSNENALAAAPQVITGANPSVPTQKLQKQPSAAGQVLKNVGGEVQSRLEKRALQTTGAQAVKAAAGETIKKTALGKAISGGINALTTALAASGVGAPVAALIKALSFFLSSLITKAISKITNWIKENKGIAMALAALGIGAVGGLPALATAGALGLLFFSFPGMLLIFVARALIQLLVFIFASIFFVTITLYIINTGAYIMPTGGFGEQFGEYSGGEPGVPLPPGIVKKCNPAQTGKDITDLIASSIKGGVVHLLPDTTGSRPLGLCIKPTVMIIHWSGGYDNAQGNDATYGTLIQRNLSCQLAVDADDQWVMQRFYENMVEMSWCAGSYNTYSINNEMAGRFFTNPPPPPNSPEVEMALDSTCKIIKRYGITRVIGHYQVPGSGKIDPGKEFLEGYFLPELQKRCKYSPKS